MNTQGAVPRDAPGCATTEAAATALSCLQLVAVPDLPRASGTVALRQPHTPFGIAVTVDGRPRQRLVATVAGLPDPRSLGAYTTYVAWAYTIALDSAVKLGVVTNGTNDLGVLEYPQFRIIVSAERSADVRERSGKLALRGTSPSARLLAHRDFMSPTAPGAPPPDAAASDTSRGVHAGHAAHGGAAAGGWPMPPTPSWMAPMPAMHDLRPSVAPFRPGAGVDPATIPLARPRRLARLAAGDTLDLEAGLVRRTVGGRALVMYGFNGQYPGPLIEVAQGASVVVRFRNAIDQPSAVHWHGVRLDNRYDGAVGVTQDAVPAGGTFTYVVRFPDAGIYWYHPHVREDVQQDLGLYGNMLVRPPRAGYWGPANREEVLMLDDLLVGDDGAVVPHGLEAPTHALMGRFGNVFLVNGEPRWSLDVRRGEVVRFFLTNVSNTRMYNLSFGSGARIKVVGSDVGKLEREEWVESVVIAPAERWVVDVEFGRAGGAALVNRVQAIDHMVGRYVPRVDTLGTVRVSAAPAAPSHAATFAALRRNADVAADLAAYRRHFDRPPDHALVATLRARGLPGAVAAMLQAINIAVEWNDGMPMMNWASTGREVTWVLRDPATGKENMDVDWRFRRGDVAKIRITNDPSSAHAMEHPIHLHGQRFLVLARDGVRSENLVWKDTAVIPAGQTMDLLVDMSNPGRWMVHCHVAEHLSTGMMAVFTVE